MNRDGDPGSCAALASVVRVGAVRLRQAVEHDADGDMGTVGRERKIIALADDLEALAEALSQFAVALRDPRPPRSGQPFAHTALRSALARIEERSATDTVLP